MNESERPSTPGTPESVWQSIAGKGERPMEMTLTPDELSAMARSRERESAWSRGMFLAVLIALGFAFAYNAISIGQVWMRLAQAWMFGWICLLVWRLRLRRGRGPGGRSAMESCASYLRREFEVKRRGLLEMRRYLFLLIPPILVSWWASGGHAPGVAKVLETMGVGRSSSLYGFASGPWVFVICGVLLVVVWFAFGAAAQKAMREMEELRRRTQE